VPTGLCSIFDVLGLSALFGAIKADGLEQYLGCLREVFDSEGRWRKAER
jgi:hypothetical protein